MPPQRKTQGCNNDERKSKATKKRQFTVVEPGAASSFISLEVSPEKLAAFGDSSNQELTALRRDLNHQAYKKSKIITFKVAKPTEPHTPVKSPSSDPHTAPIETNHDPQQAPEMNTRGAWKSNRANPNREGAGDDLEVLADALPRTARARTRKRKQTPSHDSLEDPLRPQSVKRQRKTPNDQTPTATAVTTVLDESDSDVGRTRSSERSNSHSDKENESSTMERPKLNLKLSFAKSTSTDDGFAKPATPAASSPPAQTPTIKLKVNNKQDGSAKKRKRPDSDQGAAPAQTPSSAVPKIKLKTALQPVPQSVITPGGVRLHTKGKIPKRPLGVGYDSELSDTERDPVILEGFILRMQPGRDCDYLKEHIAKGTMGHSKMQGGADVGILAYDDKGHRCCLRVRQNKYAATLVDLPTVSEGMKSWDGKRFIKSTDICQMMIVLGPVKSDLAKEVEAEVKQYPLPAGVDPKSYQYAHGLTAPMQWVRKRRFERTKRTRVDEIEAIDRKVNQLLRDDAAYQSSSWESLNYDPRQEEMQYSGTDSDDDEDADGEEEDYFNQNGDMEVDQPDEPGEQELNEFDQLFAEDDEEVDNSAAPTESGQAASGAVDSSGFATSNADSPDLTGSLAPTAAPTPGGDVSTPAAPTPGTDGDNESEDEGDGDDGDDREAKNEKDEVMSQAAENLAALEEKRAESMGQLKVVTSEILRKRIAQKVRGYDKDIAMNRRILGMPIEGED